MFNRRRKASNAGSPELDCKRRPHTPPEEDVEQPQMEVATEVIPDVQEDAPIVDNTDTNAVTLDDARPITPEPQIGDVIADLLDQVEQNEQLEHGGSAENATNPSGNTNLQVATTNRNSIIHGDMNHVPYEFCASVISHFRSVCEAEFVVAGVWKNACDEAQDKRRVYEFFLRPGKDYECWEYLFAGTSYPTLEELQRYGALFVHINHIIVYQDRNDERYRKEWHKLPEAEVPALLHYVSCQLIPKIEFDCFLDDIPENHDVAEMLFTHTCKDKIFKKLGLTYCTESSEEFLNDQVDSEEVWELHLTGNWPMSAQQTIVKFIVTNFWYVNLKGSNLEMDKTLFATIYERWASGQCSGFKIISCVDKIGQDEWRNFFALKNGDLREDYVTMDPTEAALEKYIDSRPLRATFEQDGRVTVWS